MSNEAYTRKNSADKKSFGRDVSKLVSGTVIAQIAGLCTYPVITRIFNPDIYGIASTALSIVSILLVIGCLRYEVAILLPKNDDDASSIVFACLFILVIITVLATVVIVLFGDTIAHLLNSPGLTEILWLVPVLLFIDGLYLVLRYWNTRRARFGTQALTQVTQIITGSGLRLGFGLMGFITSTALLIGQMFGNLFGTCVLLLQIIRNDWQTLITGLSPKNILLQINRYKKFPLIESWANLLNTISWQIPIFLLSAFFSPTVAGLYSLGFMCIQTPMSLIGSSIGQVYFQRGANVHRDGSLANLLEEVTSILLLLSVIPIIILLTTGGTLFGLIFGSDWSEAGVYCQILAVWAFVWFLISTTGNTTTSIIEKQEYMLRFSILHLIARASAFIIGGIMQNIYLTLWLFTLFGIISYGYSLLVTFSLTKASFRKVLSSSKRYFIFWVFVMLLLSIANYVLELPAISLLVIAGVTCIAYYLKLYRSNDLIKSYFSLK